MPNTDSRNKSIPQVRKAFNPGLCIRLLLPLLFFLPGTVHPDSQYKLLSWKGDVKVITGKTFTVLNRQDGLTLKKGDGLWLANGAEAVLRLPGGTRKVFRGPRFTRVETLGKSPATRSVLSNFINNIGLTELFSRKKEVPIGASREMIVSEFPLEKIKKAVSEIKEPALTRHDLKKIGEAIAQVESRFDVASMEKQVIIKAMVYKRFNRPKQAAAIILDYYDKVSFEIMKIDQKEVLEEYLLKEFLPITVIFGREDRGPFGFSANFQLWWAAYYYDGNQITEIEKTINTSLKPQYTFKIDSPVKHRKQNTSACLFIFASRDWSQLERLDHMEETKKEILETVLTESSRGKASGLGKVTVKIRL